MKVLVDNNVITDKDVRDLSSKYGKKVSHITTVSKPKRRSKRRDGKKK